MTFIRIITLLLVYFIILPSPVYSQDIKSNAQQIAMPQQSKNRSYDWEAEKILLNVRMLELEEKKLKFEQDKSRLSIKAMEEERKSREQIELEKAHISGRYQFAAGLSVLITALVAWITSRRQQKSLEDMKQKEFSNSVEVKFAELILNSKNTDTYNQRAELLSKVFEGKISESVLKAWKADVSSLDRKSMKHEVRIELFSHFSRIIENSNENHDEKIQALSTLWTHMFPEETHQVIFPGHPDYNSSWPPTSKGNSGRSSINPSF